MNIVQNLAKFDFGCEIYHSDGEGHIQVQQHPVDLVDPFETPYSLLIQIEQEGLWPEFLEMVKAKEDEWILNITRHFPESKFYSTTCFVAFLSILSCRDAQIRLIQDSPLWFWDEKNAPMISKVINKATQLIDATPRESMDKEIDLSILNGVISRLEAERNKNQKT